MSLDNKRSTWSASKVKLKTNGVSRTNSNVQLCCDTASSAQSHLMFMFVTGFAYFNSIPTTSLFVTLLKVMAFCKGVLLTLLYSKMYALLSFPCPVNFSSFLILYFSKRNCLAYWKRYIQNPGIFRTKSIFRTFVYLEPKAYPEHCQTSTIERFAKIAT